MKLSTKGRYGLLVMISIASIEKNSVVSLKKIATERNLSEAYLEKLVSSLKKSDLITSTRGSSGGYSLSREATDISVGDILRSSEGDMDLVTCSTKTGMIDCKKQAECSARYVWDSINDAINNVIDNISLQSLINKEKTEQRL